MAASVACTPGSPAPATPPGSVCSWACDVKAKLTLDCANATPRCTLLRLAKCGSTAAAGKLFGDSVRAINTLPCLSDSVTLRQWLQVHRVDIVHEEGGLRWTHLQRGDVLIGQIRNPFEWYASAWAYSLDGMKLRYSTASNNTYGTTEAERLQFRKWVRSVSTPDLGLLSLHLFVNYLSYNLTRERPPIIEALQAPASRVLGLVKAATPSGWRSVGKLLPNETRGTDTISLVLATLERFSVGGATDVASCWTHAESLDADLEACVRLCETKLSWQSAYLRLRKPQPVDDAAAAAALGSRRALEKGNIGPQRVPSTLLYDDATAEWVRHADYHIFRAFSYSRDVWNSKLAPGRLSR